MSTAIVRGYQTLLPNIGDCWSPETMATFCVNGGGVVVSDAPPQAPTAPTPRITANTVSRDILSSRFRLLNNSKPNPKPFSTLWLSLGDEGRATQTRRRASVL